MKLENKHGIPGPAALITAGVLAALTFLSNLVALPGPDSLFDLASGSYYYVLLGTVALPIVLIPFAGIWLFVQASRAVKVFWPVWLALLVQAILLINILLIQDTLQMVARQRVVNEGKVLVAAIESYHETNLQYPDGLSGLYPEFIDRYPSPSIIGIKSFHYARTDSSFIVSFYEDFALFLDYDMIIYQPQSRSGRDESVWKPVDSSGWWVVDVE